MIDSLILFVLIFGLIYVLFVDELPDIYDIKDWLARIGVPLIFMVVAFLIGTFAFLSPLSGIFLSLLAWRLIKWVNETKEMQNRRKIEKAAKDFITSAAGMFAAGKSLAQVIEEASEQISDPLGNEFKVMLAKGNIGGSSYPELISELARKYKVSELKAVSDIIKAGMDMGGYKSISQGLFRLGDALRKREKLLTQMIKNISESSFTSRAAVIISSGMLLLDATVVRKEFLSFAGRLDMSLGLGVIVAMFFVILKLMSKRNMV